jgi:hypothetical protein
MTDKNQLPSLDVQCQITPAKIVANIDALRVALNAQISEQSATVITVDNLKEGKELAASINKVAKAINAARIQAVKDASADIAVFETQMKELAKIATDGYEKIKQQTDAFEAEKLKLIEIILGEALGAEWDKFNVPAEFRRANVAGLVLLGSVTAKDALTTKAKAEIASRAGADKTLADQTEKRLLQLENESYKAGLAAPLERRHVAQFLFADDATYAENLAHLLNAEKEREAAAVAARQIQFEQEQRRQAEALQRQQEQHQRDLQRAKEQAEQADQNRIVAEQRAAQLEQQAAQIEQRPVGSLSLRPASIDPSEKAAVLIASGQTGGVMTIEQAKKHALELSRSGEWALIYQKSHDGGKTPSMAAVNGFLFAAVAV